jgi:FG-GAP-like repeat
VATDLNRDGNLDLISSEGPVWLGNGDGTFHEGAYLPSSVRGYHITAGDYDRDRKLDLVTAGIPFTDTVQYLRGNGTATFTSQGPFAAGSEPVGIVSGDFNGDHFPDVVTAHDLRISVLLNTGPSH